MSDKRTSLNKRKKRGASAKTIALIEPRYEAEAISIYEIKKDSTRWRGVEFYCVAGFLPMSAAPGRTPPMFVFKNSHGAPSDSKRFGGGEGVVHELAKLHLAALKRLSIAVNERMPDEDKTTYEFEFTSVEVEQPIEVRDTTYWVDLLATLPPNSPLAARFGNQIAIEIKDQHAVGFEKREDLRITDLTAIEIQLTQGMHLTFEESADRRLLADRRRWLGNLFRNPVRAKFLHRRDYVDLAKRRKNALKAQEQIRTAQHSRTINGATVPISYERGPVSRATPLPKPEHLSTDQKPLPFQEGPLVSERKTPLRTKPSTSHASAASQTAIPKQRPPRIIDRIRDWWVSFWFA